MINLFSSFFQKQGRFKMSPNPSPLLYMPLREGSPTYRTNEADMYYSKVFYYLY